MERYDLRELLEYIEPASLDYNEWLAVGFGLHKAGYSAADWDAWSQRDPARYHAGECEKKWRSFGNGMAADITAGTIVQMAKDRGWQPAVGTELDWDSEIGGKDDLTIIEKEWLEGKEVHEPKEWDPVKQLITYLELLFESSENVGYVTETWEKDGKYLPSKGAYDRTAGQLIQELTKCKGDIGSVLGDYNESAGAWIRFNPLDGKGVKNENVTDYRYALVESDNMEIDKQNAIIRELELPVICLVYSGGKSLHAIVKVEASTYEEYRKRVNYLYDVCKKNGLTIDSQNRNPSRLSRMPGVIRNGHKQFIVDSNIGKESWSEWQEWIESVNDDLPDPEPLTDYWDNLPELSPPLIDGVLRQGHKMLLAGPSKAGKSYALIELCIAIAEGKKWFEWDCTKGRVMYVNLELDRASCLHRFRDVYEAMQLKPENIGNIDIWNLRGRSLPMDKLAPKLIRRASKKNYLAIIIDPIYKIITGDENSADQMAHFCNQFDLVCTELGCAVIYCHHHSKGGQGQKRSMDRASGSGVFARDPDALLDLIELELSDDIKAFQEGEAQRRAYIDILNAFVPNWDDKVSDDDILIPGQMKKACDRLLYGEDRMEAERAAKAAQKRAQALSAWRIEATLREYPKFDPVNLWFDHPVHRPDEIGALKDLAADSEKPFWMKGKDERKKNAKKKREKQRNDFEIAFSNLEFEGDEVSANDLAEALDTSAKTLLTWFGNGQKAKNDLKNEFEKYTGEDGKQYIRRIEKGEHDQGSALSAHG